MLRLFHNVVSAIRKGIKMTEVSIEDAAAFRPRLGRKAVKHDSRTLKLAKYMTTALPPPPTSILWNKGVTEFGMMLNDTLGCCTIAGAAHAVQIFSLNAGTEVTLSDAEVLAYYEKWDGYVQGNAATDQGGIELDVLNAWKAQEFAGHALLAWADVSTGSASQIKQAIFLFGGVYIGLEVPNFIMSNIPPLWDVVDDDGGIDGGHCVFVVGYDSVGLTFISWGALYKMTWAFWTKYVDEAHALLSKDFLGANGLDPAGFNLAALQADLACIS
jgi:hypothetical protein